MDETILRKVLLGIALLGLLAGLAVRLTSAREAASQLVWSVGTVPVLGALAIAILRALASGRLGVDIIALIAMGAALILDQALAAIVIAIMYAGGAVLEDFARGRATSDLSALVDRSPRVAHRRSRDALETIGVDQVLPGDELLVAAGELVPVDGILLEASATIDEAVVSGEPLPAHREAGEALRSGTVNAGDMFVMCATATADRSTYAAIVRMVEAAQTARAPFMRMADRYALLLLPLTLVTAALAWEFSGDPLRALSVFVVATPCPLILAAPVAFVAGMSRAARAGVVMKGSAALEALAGVRTAVFDKTGTLTQGGAEILEFDVAPGRDRDTLLRALASLEQVSRHVVADALARSARSSGMKLSTPLDVREHRGAGIEGIVDGMSIRAGSRQLVIGEAPLPLWAEAGEERYRQQPVLRVFVAIDGRLAAILTLGDALRAEAAQTLALLRASGVERIVMLTGDNEDAARRIGSQLALDAVLADANPTEKVTTVEAEKARAPTMMIGDGINDAPALASATVGLAMGARGATASSQAADVVVLADSLGPVADAVRIARDTRRIARQCIIGGMGLSVVAMAAAAFGYIQPVEGALIQEAIDVVVVLNAMRALGGNYTSSSSRGE